MKGSPGASSPLTQMVSGLVGQLLMPLHTGESPDLQILFQMFNRTAVISLMCYVFLGDQTSTTSSSHSFTFSTSSSTAPPSSANTSAQTSTHTTNTASVGQSQEVNTGDSLAQLLSSFLGGAAGANVGAASGGGAFTVTVPGVSTFIQGLSEFVQVSPCSSVGRAMHLQCRGYRLISQCFPIDLTLHFSSQSGQPVFPPPNQQPPPAQATPTAPSAAAPTTPQRPSGGGETMSPELFTGIVQGVLSTMMGSLGAGQGNTESIAQFVQRLSQTSNLFTPGTGDAVGEYHCREIWELKRNILFWLLLLLRIMHSTVA